MTQRASPDSAGRVRRGRGWGAPTNLVGDGEGGVQAVILDDGAAPLWRADGADIGHAQGVAGVVAAQVLVRRARRGTVS